MIFSLLIFLLYCIYYKKIVCACVCVYIYIYGFICIVYIVNKTIKKLEKKNYLKKFTINFKTEMGTNKKKNVFKIKIQNTV